MYAQAARGSDVIVERQDEVRAALREHAMIPERACRAAMSLSISGEREDWDSDVLGGSPSEGVGAGRLSLEDDLDTREGGEFAEDPRVVGHGAGIAHQDPHGLSRTGRGDESSPSRGLHEVAP